MIQRKHAKRTVERLNMQPKKKKAKPAKTKMADSSSHRKITNNNSTDIDIKRSRRRLTIHQKDLAIARLQAGRSQSQVAHELGVSQSVIGRLHKRHQETGTVSERPRSGRPMSTSGADDRFIVDHALKNGSINATQLQARLRKMRGTQVSRQTIRNRLHQHGLAYSTITDNTPADGTERLNSTPELNHIGQLWNHGTSDKPHRTVCKNNEDD